MFSRGRAGLEGTVKDVEANGQRGLGVSVDVADLEAVMRATRQVEDDLGPVDLWVNVAFVGSLAFFWDTSPRSSDG